MGKLTKFECKSCQNIFMGNDFSEHCNSCNSAEIIKVKKKNKYTIASGLFFLFVLLMYSQFQSKVADFHENLPKLQELELIEHNEEEEYWGNYYQNEIKKSEINYWYSSTFKDPMFQKDTTIRYIFFFKTFNYLSFKNNFWKCNYKNAINQNSFDSSVKKKSAFINKIIRKHRLSDKELKKLLKITDQSENFPLVELSSKEDLSCEECIENFKPKLTYDDIKAEDFSSFTEQFITDKKNAKYQNDKSKRRYETELHKNIGKLGYSVKNFVNSKLQASDYISKETKVYKYKGKTKGIGDVQYSFNLRYYNSDNSLPDKIASLINEYYKNNSLRNGAQPYRYCYGRNPVCTPPYGYSECSSITVKSPYNSDVLVIIKKRDKVYSHGYVKAGRRVKFDVTNGYYETFFYYGDGWNPHKFMKKTSCGNLKGGFMNSEVLSKDDGVRLRNQGVTYELILQENGNFQTTPSNINEAF